MGNFEDGPHLVKFKKLKNLVTFFVFHGISSKFCKNGDRSCGLYFIFNLFSFAVLSEQKLLFFPFQTSLSCYVTRYWCRVNAKYFCKTILAHKLTHRHTTFINKLHEIYLYWRLSKFLLF